MVKKGYENQSAAAKRTNERAREVAQERRKVLTQRNLGRDPDNPIIGSQAYADKKAAEQKTSKKEDPK